MEMGINLSNLFYIAKVVSAHPSHSRSQGKRKNKEMLILFPF
jgi:hypothetical protein